MAISEAYANSATIGATEYSLPNNAAMSHSGPDNSITVDGVYQVFLDLAALLNSDVFEIRFYETLQASTPRVFWMTCVANAQGTDGALWVSPSFVLMNGWDVTLKKAAGTDRTIYWSIRKIA